MTSGHPRKKAIPRSLAAPAVTVAATESAAEAAFPIVGIGASAGGLAAFEAFFSGMPSRGDPRMGFGLGAHLAPGAASGEHRFAACIADCGTFDMYATFLSRLPEQVRGPYEAGDAQLVAGVSQMLDQRAAAPTGRSARRPGVGAPRGGRWPA